jgi:thiamine-phosphate diphosphorylase/hydroxyethylthiazole kinase
VSASSDLVSCLAFDADTSQRKKDVKSIIGTSGVRDILAAITKAGQSIPTVCIGGLNASNVTRVLWNTQHEETKLQGVAVVSAVIAAADPCMAAKQLRRRLGAADAAVSGLTEEGVDHNVAQLVAHVVRRKPLCHNMTNTVVQTMAANMAIAVGGSPIMSDDGDEAADLAKLGGSLVVNLGIVTADSVKQYSKAISAYNTAGRPVLLDPVGCGATQVRRQALKTIMDAGYFDVIKGNEGEITTVLGTSGATQQHGVDSGLSSLSLDDKAEIVEELARRERCIVVMTGSIDILSDGWQTVFVSNGHGYMGEVTGSGCTLGTVIGAFIAVHEEDKLMATLAAMLLFEIAAEDAVAHKPNAVGGPGSFLPAWLDKLYEHAHSLEVDAGKWIQKRRIVIRKA